MVLGCVGHWYAELLYVAPVFLTVGWLGVHTRLERRRAARADAEPVAADVVAQPSA